MTLRLQRRRFCFALLQPLRTASGVLRERCGWLLRLDDEQGAVGWGEVAPLQQQQFTACEQALAALPEDVEAGNFRSAAAILDAGDRISALEDLLVQKGDAR